MFGHLPPVWQTCLANQLKDLYARDQLRITDGKAPLYLLSQYTYGYNVNVSPSPASVIPAPLNTSAYTHSSCNDLDVSWADQGC